MLTVRKWHALLANSAVQDILEEMDPVLEPVLAKAFIKRGNQTLIKLGDKEIDFNPDFKLYITSKLQNPHYTPEVSTKVMILNFAVKEDGLEAQLLNTVVKMERPDLDQQKNELVRNVARGKRTQARTQALLPASCTSAV
jgi:dynein heavy chain, axonemal